MDAAKKNDVSVRQIRGPDAGNRCCPRAGTEDEQMDG